MQFGTEILQVDMRVMRCVLGFDRERGLGGVKASIPRPELVRYLIDVQRRETRRWYHPEADRLWIGGALAANVHNRGLVFKPVVCDAESFI